MSSCLLIQHVAPEQSFAIGGSLRAAGVDLDTRRVFAGDVLPLDVAGFDGLVVMGGPMSANTDEGFLTRRAEIALLKDALDAGIPTLGVCLGAQLLALSGGGSVSPGASGLEIGWAPVIKTAACDGDLLFADLPDELIVLHWHSDTIEIPGDARRLFRNATYPNQGFRMGECAWGVQFHLEVDEDAVDGFLLNFASDAKRAEGGASAIKAATARALAGLAPVRDVVAGRFARLVGEKVTTQRIALES
jgi:GMP synthase-like glutamine amidotransferase